MQRAARIGAGVVMITAGTAMLALPGPGLLTIAGGLAVLSKDVEWAGRASEWFKDKARQYSSPPSTAAAPSPGASPEEGPTSAS